MVTGANRGPSDSTDIHYIGLRFWNETNSSEDYGYIAIQQSVSPATQGSVQILGWPCDDNGSAVTVNGISAVPEPATYAMFGGGLLSARMGARRRGPADILPECLIQSLVERCTDLDILRLSVNASMESIPL